MTTYVALLRGINVGGKNLIRMPALKACFEEYGFANVSTYIQSGNVLFASPERGSKTLSDRIEDMLAKTFDYVPMVVVRSKRQMKSIVDRAPEGFGARPAEYRYNVIFLKEPLSAKAAITTMPTNPAVDTAHAGPRVLYFSNLTARATASRLSQITASPIYPSVTLRNWN